jgi:hypothetical protein
MPRKAHYASSCLIVAGFLLALTYAPARVEAQKKGDQNKVQTPSKAAAPAAVRKVTPPQTPPKPSGSKKPPVASWRQPPERLELLWSILLDPVQNATAAAAGAPAAGRMTAEPTHKFVMRERVQIAVRPLQEGYLYAFSQRQGQKSEAANIYRNSHARLPKLKEELLPGDCSRPQVQCWLTLPAERGTLFFTFIFSRKKIPDLLKVVALASNFEFNMATADRDLRRLNEARGIKVEQVKDKNEFRITSIERLADQLMVTIPFMVVRRVRVPLSEP